METDVRALATRLDPVPQIITLSASSLDGVFADIATVGAALGLADEAAEFEAGARMRMRRVHETLKAAQAPRPRVAVIEWGDPIYAAGHWVPEMVKRAGGVDVLAKPGEHSVVKTGRGAHPTPRSCLSRPVATTSRAPPRRRNACSHSRVGSGRRSARCSRSTPMPSPRVRGHDSWTASR
jgi:hypothetical protein